MRSFSFMLTEIKPDMYYKLNAEIGKLKWYFVRFAGKDADEAMQKTFVHTLYHYNPSRGELFAYLKKLAREICKDPHKIVFVDFIEQTLADGGIIEDGSLTPTVDTGRSSDFSNDVIKTLMDELDDDEDAIRLALDFMPQFCMLCDAVGHKDSSSVYYPDIFKQTVTNLCRKHKNFMQRCLRIYNMYRLELEQFLQKPTEDYGVWREADIFFVRNNMSKRIKLYNKATGLEVQDADFEDFCIDGSLSRLGNKRIYRVWYVDLWESLCDMADSKSTNKLKFIIGKYYKIRTLGGSESIVNTDLFNLYDLLRFEILTNVLRDTNAKILNIGSSCFYLLGEEKYMEIPSRVVQGIEINLSFEDITDSVG